MQKTCLGQVKTANKDIKKSLSVPFETYQKLFFIFLKWKICSNETEKIEVKLGQKDFATMCYGQ